MSGENSYSNNRVFESVALPCKNPEEYIQNQETLTLPQYSQVWDFGVYVQNYAHCTFESKEIHSLTGHYKVSSFEVQKNDTAFFQKSKNRLMAYSSN
jgi:hypothetical protein